MGEIETLDADMTKSVKDDAQPRRDGPATEPSTKHDADRRAALLKMGGLAASVAPAMLVLTSGKANSRGGPKAPCDSPAWELGLSRAGHSGC